MKKQIAKAISDAIRTALEYVDEQLVQVRDRMAEAQGNDQVSRQQVLKDVRIFPLSASSLNIRADFDFCASSQMFERRKEEAAQKKDEKTADARFQIVAKRDSVIIPNAGHEAGYINKQAERQAAAGEGTGWHSKAFSIINPIPASSVEPHADASRST